MKASRLQRRRGQSAERRENGDAWSAGCCWWRERGRKYQRWQRKRVEVEEERESGREWERVEERKEGRQQLRVRKTMPTQGELGLHSSRRWWLLMGLRESGVCSNKFHLVQEKARSSDGWRKKAGKSGTKSSSPLEGRCAVAVLAWSLGLRIALRRGPCNHCQFLQQRSVNYLANCAILSPGNTH